MELTLREMPTVKLLVMIVHFLGQKVAQSRIIFIMITHSTSSLA